MKKEIVLLCIILIPLGLFGKAYKGAEYRTKEAYTYGRFEVRMKSAQRDGMLSSFFTYHENTGAADWNEIDIEILGRYADDLQFNPITPGQVNHVSHYQTPFNPALDFHTYAFEWTPTYVAWFVEGEEVHRQTGEHIEALNLPQKIMMNVWNPSYEQWAGSWNENVLPAFAYYDWVSYSAYTPDSGSTGTGNNFTLLWKDDFDLWDQNRWQKATHTWNGNGCDFVAENAVIQDGKLILCLTKETSLAYTDNAAPSVIAVRGEKNGILVLFSEEVDSASAVTTSNYAISGKTISNALLYSDQKSVKLIVEEYDTSSLGTMIVRNVKDRFVPANTTAPKNITITKTTPLSLPARINCGGPSYKNYLADQPWGPAVEYGYMDGSLYTNTESFPSSADPGVFNSELNGAAKYMVRVPNGTYTVILMMAENYFTSAGKRMFSIAVQGNMIEQDLDLFAKVGKSKLYQKAVQNVAVKEGVLDIHFMNGINTSLLNGIQIIQVSTGAGETHNEVPLQWNIGQNFPNPFNGQTTIPLELPSDDVLTIRFYDTLGRSVSELPVGSVSAGKHYVSWKGKDLYGNAVASGVYYCVVHGRLQTSTMKVMLIQ